MIDARLYLGQYYVTTMALKQNYPPEYLCLAVFDKLPMATAKPEDQVEAVEHKVARFRMVDCISRGVYKYCLEELV